jgi:hypothetical protein
VAEFVVGGLGTALDCVPARGLALEPGAARPGGGAAAADPEGFPGGVRPVEEEEEDREEQDEEPSVPPLELDAPAFALCSPVLEDGEPPPTGTAASGSAELHAATGPESEGDPEELEGAADSPSGELPDDAAGGSGCPPAGAWVDGVDDAPALLSDSPVPPFGDGLEEIADEPPAGADPPVLTAAGDAPASEADVSEPKGEPVNVTGAGGAPEVEPDTGDGEPEVEAAPGDSAGSEADLGFVESDLLPVDWKEEKRGASRRPVSADQSTAAAGDAAIMSANTPAATDRQKIEYGRTPKRTMHAPLPNLVPLSEHPLAVIRHGAFDQYLHSALTR